MHRHCALNPWLSIAKDEELHHGVVNARAGKAG